MSLILTAICDDGIVVASEAGMTTDGATKSVDLWKHSQAKDENGCELPFIVGLVGGRGLCAVARSASHNWFSDGHTQEALEASMSERISDLQTRTKQHLNPLFENLILPGTVEAIATGLNDREPFLIYIDQAGMSDCFDLYAGRFHAMGMFSSQARLLFEQIEPEGKPDIERAKHVLYRIMRQATKSMDCLVGPIRMSTLDIDGVYAVVPDPELGLLEQQSLSLGSL